MKRLPEPGYTRLKDILTLFGVSRSSWYAAIEKGRIEPGTKLSARTVAWPNSYLNRLLDQLEEGKRIL